MSEAVSDIEKLSPRKLALYELLLKKKKSESVARTRIRPRVRSSNSSLLSFAQQRLWLIDQLEPGNAMYNSPVALRLSGRLNVTALERTLSEIVRRHEVLRSTFSVIDDRPSQVIAPAAALSLPVFDVSELPEEEREAKARHLASEEARRPFNLSKGPLVRASLVRLGAEEHIALFTLHHIVSDAWSTGVFVREVGALYEAFLNGQPSPLPELPIQYADFAVWQHEWLQEKTLAAEVAYWRNQLAGAPPTLALPTDHLRPAVQTHEGAVVTWVIPESLINSLKALSKREGSTLFMTLLSAFKILLYRYTGQTDLVIGTPIAGRNRSEVENLIGFFINTLVLRTRLASESSFRELLGQVREVALEAYAHQELPFEKLVEELNPERSLSHAPVFQVTFGLQNVQRGTLELPGLTLAVVGVESKTARADLGLNLIETESTIVANLQYSTDLFVKATIRRMASHFQQLLASVVEHPEARISQLTFLTESEKEQQLVEWNDTVVDYPRYLTLHELFEAQAARTPDAVALVHEDKQLTYGELNERANQVAHYLRETGVGLETLVGLCFERSLEMIVALLGVVKAGGAYVPLDPRYPLERLSLMMEDSGVSVLLTQERLSEVIPAGAVQVIEIDAEWGEIGERSKENPPPRAGADNLAYVIYTSGSSGRPKGTLITHRGLWNLSEAQREVFAVRPEDSLLQFASLSFDASIFEIVMALHVGATLCLATSDELGAGDPLLKLLRERSITMATLPPTVLATLKPEELPELRTIVVAGEACPAELIGPWSVGRRFFNAYGPTEATVWSTTSQCSAGDEKVTIGRPMANTQVYVLAGDLQPLPTGVTGELYIGGVGLARGYLHRPDLTAERFVPNPFSSKAGARLYRTGDLVRHLSDGNLEFIGRVDEQVKVRGFRIELGEIESVLCAHEAVRECVVVVREDAPGDRRLVAYVVGDEGAEALDSGVLRARLKETLPDYMVPAAFVTLAEIPLTPNLKIDRKALPIPEQNRSESGPSYVAARTPVEEVLCGMYEQVLRVERIDVHDNFFELGGHSLLATQIISRLKEAFQVEVPLRSLFEAPTVAGFSEVVQEAIRNGHGLPVKPIEAASREGNLPLSFAQQRLWFVDQLEGGHSAYNVPAAIRLRGLLNLPALEKTLSEVVRRHEILRTTLPMVDGQPVQAISPPQPIHLPVVNLSELPEDERETKAHELSREEARAPFDLINGPLLRAGILRLGEDEHIVLFTMHHIISDGWSMSVLVREVSTLYTAFSEGEASPLPELLLQYADFAVWQRGWFQGEVLERQLAYWKQQLAGAPPVLELPTDRPRPAVQTYRGAHQPLVLDETLTSAIKQLARSEDATLFMTFLAAFQLLLHHYTASEDIVVGTDIANRNHGETEKMIGFFVNQLVMRTDLAGDPTFKELLGRVREMTLEAYTHQDVPFDKLVEVLNPGRDLSRTPLFQVKIIIQNTPREILRISDLKLGRLSQEAGVARFDLVLNISDTGDRVVGTVEYNTDLFEAPTITQIANHFRMVLASAVANPERRLSQFSLLSQEERQQQLVEWNDTAVDYPRYLTLHELFEAQAARTPDAVALVHEDQQLTYEELNERANQVAHYLRETGVGLETLVGLCFERSLEMIVALLGVVKAGGAYVPLDPRYPLERLSLMMEDSGVSVLLTQERLSEVIPAGAVQVIEIDAEWEVIGERSKENPAPRAGADNLAYVIYTSGSSGRPKGTLITHRGLWNLSEAQREVFAVRPEDRVLQFASLSFDSSIFEIVWALGVGATLCLATPDELGAGDPLLKLLRERSITMAALPPTVLATLKPEELPELRTIVVAGEACPAELIGPWSVGRRFFNGYGPTEATVWSTMSQCSAGDEKVTIGRPMANTQVYVLDRHMQPVPLGVNGELYTVGPGLARGYLRRPDLTAERFVPNPFSSKAGARLYRTGDLVRYLSDGNLEFIGRVDEQVKVRGFRIELGEIESVLCAHEAVRECVVVVREDAPGDKRLVAYVVGDEAAQAADSGALRTYLKNIMPDYMVPAAFVTLAEIPLTPNLKIDRKALPIPEQNRSESGPSYVAARTPVEEVLCGMYEQVLRVEQVSVHDNFFELGGHSLLAAHLISEIKKAFDLELPLRNIFDAPTIAELAGMIEAAKRAVEGIDVPPIKPVPRDIELPLSFAQQRLWFMDQLEPGSALYNSPCVMRLKGKLDIEALERGFNEIYRRHEILRTVYPMVNGQPVQVIEPAQPLQIPLTDLTTLADGDRESEALRLTVDEARRPFDLARGPVIRVGLLRLGEEDHIIHFMMHHITCDAWSLGVLVREITLLYDAFVKGEPSPLPEITIQYSDYAYWQQNWLRGEVLESELQYWKRQLSGTLPVLMLPTARPQLAVPGYEGTRYSFKLPAELSMAIRQMSWSESVTTFMTLLAIFKLLLYRYTKLEDIIVGTAHANRNHADTENLIGFFINMLVMRTDLSGHPSFRELLRRVREVALDAYMHQDMPFEKIVEEMQLKRDAGNTPIFQVAFGVENERQAAYSLENSQSVNLQALTMSPVSFDMELVRYDLTLWIKEGKDGLYGWWNYKTSLFDLASIKQIHGHFVTLLQSAIEQPDAKLDALEMFSESDKEQQASEQKSLEESRHRRLKAVKPQPVRVMP